MRRWRRSQRLSLAFLLCPVELEQPRFVLAYFVRRLFAPLQHRRESKPFLVDRRRRLGEFRGVGRRFTKVGEVNGAAIIDDYAHNPFKIAAALLGGKEYEAYK